MNEVALLVVDVQNDVMAESVNAAPVIETIVGLVHAARKAAVPVIWVQHSADDLPRESPGWQLVPELVPTDAEPIVHKTWGDAFAETDLAQRLRVRGAKRVILCGAQTDACIRSTFYGGIHRGFDITLVEDAHTTGDRREFGFPYGPDEAIRVLNAQAAHTRQPGATGAVTTAVAAFA